MSGSNFARMLLLTISLLFSLGLSGCCRKIDPGIILPEERIEYLGKDKPAPFDGWLLTDSAMIKLKEKIDQAPK